MVLANYKIHKSYQIIYQEFQSLLSYQIKCKWTKGTWLECVTVVVVWTCLKCIRVIWYILLYALNGIQGVSNYYLPMWKNAAIGDRIFRVNNGWIFSRLFMII